MSSAKTASHQNKKFHAGLSPHPDMPSIHSTPVIPLFLGGALFLSGVSALIYQVLWIRQLSLVVGVEVYSITIAVSAFFAGLALGGAVLGHLSERWTRPLQFYALLEVCIAIIGFIATVLLAHSARAFVLIESRAGLLAWMIPFLLVGVPAFLMGGTLPAAVRAAASGSVRFAEAGGWIYAANTAGGIAGALLSSFALVPWLGIRGSAIAAGLFNLAAAGLASLQDRHTHPSVMSSVEQPSPVPFLKSRTALVLYGNAGGVALGYEVVWSQAMAQFLSTRVFAFSVVLATYLTGLTVGSALSVRWLSRLRDTWGTFGLLIAAAGAIALLEVSFIGLWQLQIQAAAGHLVFALTGQEALRMYARFLVAALGVVFVPTILLGAAFPIVLKLAVSASHPGRGLGVVLALNTAGGIAGTLITGFLLIPTLGIVRTLGILAIVAAAIGVLSVFLGTSVSRKMQIPVVAVGIAAVATGVLTTPDRLSRLLLTTRGGGDLIFYQESKGSTVAVAQQRSGDNVFRRLYVQGVSNSGDAMPSMRYMRLQALLPLIIHHGEPRSALVVGFGTGITAGAMLHYPKLERRLCVELLPAVVQAGKLFPENYGVASNPAMQIRIRDGRHELLANAAHYDLITLEPPPPSAEGVVNLYSTEFYRLAGERLAHDGLFAQWLPISTQNEDDTRSLVRSFLDAFPYATLWSTELHEMLLVGSYSPISLDADQISRRFSQADVATALQSVGVASPAALLATWITDRIGLERFAASAPAVTDDHPRIEYSAWVHPREIVTTLPDLLALSTDPTVANMDDAARTAMNAQRDVLRSFYTAGIAAYNGDREQWSRSMQRVLAADPSNPYYLWIGGGR